MTNCSHGVIQHERINHGPPHDQGTVDFAPQNDPARSSVPRDPCVSHMARTLPRRGRLFWATVELPRDGPDQALWVFRVGPNGASRLVHALRMKLSGRRTRFGMPGHTDHPRCCSTAHELARLSWNLAPAPPAHPNPTGLSIQPLSWHGRPRSASRSSSDGAI